MDTTVLVVEDEPDLAELYETWLSDSHAVRIARTGRGALAAFDEDVDVALLDRQLDGMDGREVLEAIRESDSDCRIAMVTAVAPDVDILDMGFDEYVHKPTTADELRDTVEGLLERVEYDERVKEYFALASKKAALEAEMEAAELENNEEFAALESRLTDARERADEILADLDDEEFPAVFGPRDPAPGSIGTERSNRRG